MSYPYPREWLEECRRAYQVKSREELENAPWMEAIKGELRKQMEEAGELLSQALEIAGEGDGPGFYIPLLEEEKKCGGAPFPGTGNRRGRRRPRILYSPFGRRKKICGTPAFYGEIFSVERGYGPSGI